MRVFLALCALVGATANLSENPEELAGVQVETEYGNVEGFTRRVRPGEKEVDVFWGIPFAAPPVGENRFKPPQPFAKPWAPKVRSAKRVPQICDQLDIAGNLHLGGEDCLYLNVYRPHGATIDSNLPVMVWIYGGGYFIGDGYEFTLYDATHIVKMHEYIVVTMNYRLSGFGFFALPELASEDKDGTTGNYGVQDQRAALQWVQRNIRGFGGDPTQVTVAGESAGAFSVMFHLVSPASRGLFRAAIMESGTSHLTWFFQNKTEAFEFYTDFTAILGCNVTDRLGCLRRLPAHDIAISFAQMAKDIAARGLHLPLPKDIPEFASPLWPLMPFGPVIDGSPAGLPDVPLTLIQRGEFHKVPLIIGANKDGGAYFGPAIPLLWGTVRQNFTKLTEYILPKSSDRETAMELYGDPSFKKDRFRMDRAMRDVVFQCSDRQVATAWSKAGMPAYLFVFSFDFKGLIGSVLGDAHALELPFVFRNYVEILGDLVSEPSRYEQMANKMSCTWASFVKCQKPKCPTSPPHCEDTLKDMVNWPAFSAPSNRKYMSLKDETSIESIQKSTVYGKDEFPGDDRCDFWASAELDFRHLRKDISNLFLNVTRPSTFII